MLADGEYGAGDAATLGLLGQLCPHGFHISQALAAKALAVK